MNRIVTHEENYPIQPKDIDGTKHFGRAFDNMETEISARWIIRFLQWRGEGWKPFTHQEIEAFYNRKQQNGFTFNRLIKPETVPISLVRGLSECVARPPEKKQVGGGWIVVSTENNYFVTEDFIQHCYKSSPMSKKE